MEENGINKKEIVETIKISNNYPIIKEKCHDITEQFNDFQRQRNFYLSDNKILKCKNCELNNEYDFEIRF